jgi:hypothetical protein
MVKRPFLGSATAEHVAEVMDLAEAVPDTGDIMPGWSSLHGVVDVTVTSWANMGLYDCDFGEGVWAAVHKGI